MATLDVNGTSINYIVEGNGPTVVLVHGFASNLQANWRAPGIIDALVTSGRQVVALDCRGHGRSDKPHDPTAYEGTHMTDDVLALMDHLDIMQADLAGYSMGGIFAATLLVRAPMRFRSVVLAGIGNTLLTRGPNSERAQAIARALDADDSGASESATARGFRRGGADCSGLRLPGRAHKGVRVVGSRHCAEGSRDGQRQDGSAVCEPARRPALQGRAAKNQPSRDVNVENMARHCVSVAAGKS